MTILLLALMVICAILFVATLRRFPLPSIRIWHPEQFVFSAVWIASYGIFLFFWLPQNTFYKLFALPAIILFIASLWTPGRDPAAPAAWFVGTLALFNLSFAIIPYSRTDANAAVQFALNLRLENGARVYYTFVDNADSRFARYFNPQSEWRHTLVTGPIDDDLRAGKTVWLDTTAIDHFTSALPEWVAQRTRSGRWVELVTSQHRIRFVRLHGPGS